MFGKLFGYVALIRAGLLSSSSTTTQEVIDRLLALYSKKSWLQELIIEAFLSFLSFADKELQQFILTKTEDLYTVSFAEMNVNQLLFYLGLQHFAKENGSFGKLWKESLTKKSLETSFDMNKLDVVSDTLLSSSRKFPKVCALIGLLFPFFHSFFFFSLFLSLLLLLSFLSLSTIGS
jgi:hypothetical protein